MKIKAGKGKIKRLFKQLFKRRESNHIPVYLSRFETIEKLIKGGLLAIDLKSRYVCIDTSLHIQYMESERKYAAFFNNIRAYINFRFGLMQEPVLKPEDRINFGVMLRQTVMYNQETGEFYDPPLSEYRILIVGANMNNAVVYEPYEAKDTSTESTEHLHNTSFQ